jgi:RNA polymerase sigma factor (sigma-70 family)
MTREMAELTEVELEALVRRARAGDHGALGELYDRYRDRVARFAAGRLGDAERAEDVTSETFEGVLRGLPASRPGTDFEAWLFTIAHRRVADHFRRRARRREVELARRLRHHYLGPEHLLLGLLGDAEDPVETEGYDDERRLRGPVGLPDRGPHAIRLPVEAHGLTLETLRSAVRGELDRPA